MLVWCFGCLGERWTCYLKTFLLLIKSWWLFFSGNSWQNIDSFILILWEYSYECGRVRTERDRQPRFLGNVNSSVVVRVLEKRVGTTEQCFYDAFVSPGESRACWRNGVMKSVFLSREIKVSCWIVVWSFSPLPARFSTKTNENLELEEVEQTVRERRRRVYLMKPDGLIRFHSWLHFLLKFLKFLFEVPLCN